ncbi:hypothetical protein QJQ45_002641 [Haematococcus lacustris]|nr:hypothetical protein QJQ45_002641 [Haematococcus lacustris]
MGCVVLQAGFAEFVVDETFGVPGVGTVVAGTVKRGVITPNMTLMLGPDIADGSFKPAAIKSIHYKRLAVGQVVAGQTAALALKKVKRSQVRKGMVMVDERSKPAASWEFDADIAILTHSTTIQPRYQAVIHCEIIRQAARVVAMDCERLRSGDRACVRFRFLQRPEYMTLNTRFVFREGRTKGIGIIIGTEHEQLPPPPDVATTTSAADPLPAALEEGHHRLEAHYAMARKKRKVTAKQKRGLTKKSKVRGRLQRALCQSWSSGWRVAYGIDAKSSELQATDLDKEHVADRKEEAAKHRRLLGIKEARFPAGHPAPALLHATRGACLPLLQQQQQPSSSPKCSTTSGPCGGTPPHRKRIAEQRHFVFNSATQIEVGIDPGPHLQHLAAASLAGIPLEANLKHITVTLATWDMVWEVYLDPKWARERLRLYEAQDQALEQFLKKLEEEMAELSMERHGLAKQLVVFLGAAVIVTGSAGPMQQPSSHTASSPGARASTPPPAKRTKAQQAAEPTEPTKGEGKAKGRAANTKLPPQPGSAQHAAHWEEQVAPTGAVLAAALPAKGKEYQGLGYKRLRDKPPKAQQQQPAGAQQCAPT